MVNSSEKFVYRVAQKSFLSLWSYVNPLNERDKELCDILVVCEPDIIIISVKDRKVTNSGDVSRDWKRWHKRAVDESVKQIYGAERWIKSATNVIRSDGTPGLLFPNESERRIHRVAVAVGSEGNVPIRFGDFGKGFVHVFDEMTFEIILSELDTISDFTAYLKAKETLCKNVPDIIMQTEEDLLAWYLKNQRTFPTDVTSLIIDEGQWSDFSKSEEYRRKQHAD